MLILRGNRENFWFLAPLEVVPWYLLIFSLLNFPSNLFQVPSRKRHSHLPNASTSSTLRWIVHPCNQIGLQTPNHPWKLKAHFCLIIKYIFSITLSGFYNLNKDQVLQKNVWILHNSNSIFVCISNKETRKLR